MNRCMAFIAVLSFCVLTVHTDVSAMWEEDGNLIITGASESFWFPENCSDDAGGAIIVWQDYTGFCYILHAQRIDSYGHRLWPANGVPLNGLTSGNQYFHRVIADGVGGAIVVWINDFWGSADVYAQRVDADGNLLWGTDGLAVCVATGSKYEPDLVSDGLGGAIFTWADSRGADIDIYVQRVNEGGTPLWTADGLIMTSAAGTQEEPRITTDNYGGAIVAWEDNRGADQDIYVRHVSAYGTVDWLGDGTPVCVLAGWQELPVIASDGAGGAIIAWVDPRTTPYSIYAQRVDRAATARWDVNGNMVSDPLFGQNTVVIMPDGQGGAFAAWEEGAGGVMLLAAQRISVEGDTLWGSGGVKIYDMEWDFDFPEIISDDEGGMIVAWADNRVGNYNVYAQRINSEGEPYWNYGGRVLCDAFDQQYYVRIAPDGAGGAIASYHDNRAGVQELYAQRITAQGGWGYPCPDIYSAKDIPGDEGGLVNVAWYASRLDYGDYHMVSHYSIWRAIEESAAMQALRNEAFISTGEIDISPDMKPGTIRVGQLLGEPYFWELLGTTGASFIETYAAVVPTLFDSTDTSADQHYFQIMAHTDDPLVFWTSEPDSGYSVDNLAPCPPLALAGEQSFTPEGLLLTWAPNEEPDLDCYRIYRGIDPGFTPGTGSLLVQQCDTLLLDDGWSWDVGYWYKVAAVDIHGNESVFAVLGPDMVTGEDPMPLPDATFLSQNYPNPFNPVTNIGFGLKEQGRISLRIYDAAGRLVTTLIDESRPAGNYTADWNGRGTNDRAVSIGVYFYRLTTKEFEETRKMILLR